jgi:AraC-like DNA-binding protein
MPFRAIKVKFTAVLFVLDALCFFALPPSVLSETTVDQFNIRISLSGDWKIMAGDDIKYAAPDYNDASWDSIALPGTMIQYIRPKLGKTGVHWVRKKIFIDKNRQKKDLGLILGTISQADETFFNGVKIGATGSFPDNGHSMWNFPRHYVIPHQLVRFGSENVIAVRVYSYIYCDMIGNLAVTNIEDFNNSKKSNEFVFITLNYIIMGMGVPFFIIFLLFFLMRRDSQEYLFYSLQLLCGLFITFDTCTSWNVYGSLINRYKILGISWVALNVVHPIFLHRIYNLQRKKTEMLLWLYLASNSIIALFFCDETNLYELGLLLICMTTPIGLYNLSCHIYALYKKRPYSKLFSVFGMTVILGAIHDGITYFLKYSGLTLGPLSPFFENMVFSYTALMLYLGTSAILVHRFINMMDEVEDLNANLESFVIENALLNERLLQSGKKSSSHSLTNRAEEKIKRVLRYIKNNYTFDLSREGLAASINIHPDNLSKLFKMSTGMKLGDYVNDLRIKEAAKKLAETDEKVIDIAFSVGFDSLRTFDRVFQKFMKTTPEKYRMIHKNWKKPPDSSLEKP